MLWYKEERTILIKHEVYDYHWPHFRPDEMPEWVYFSSISDHALPYHDQVADWLEDNPDVKLAFQPGTFQIEAGTERLKKLYQHTELVVLNREEAVTVTGGSYDDVHGLLDKLHALGPKIAIVTDGPAGAYASDGNERLKMPLYPDPAPPFERTGAGDAFASTFVAAIVKGHNLESALQWGTYQLHERRPENRRAEGAADRTRAGRLAQKGSRLVPRRQVLRSGSAGRKPKRARC